MTPDASNSSAVSPSPRLADSPPHSLTPIQKWISFAAHNRMLVIALTAAAVAYSIYTMKNIRLDAIPDLSDTQVIVYTKWDRSPDIVEDQVTYPIITALLGAPKVKAIRGFSDFGFCYVYVIFQDGTDIYWARSRVLEYLQKISGNLPTGVTPELGPDATGVGWVFRVRAGGQIGQAQPRRAAHVPGLVSALRPAKRAGRGGGGGHRRIPEAVPGHHRPQPAAELRPVGDGDHGGDPPQQQRSRRPAHRVDAAASTWCAARGYVQDTEALGKVVVKASAKGTPVLLRDVATIALGPQMRRGIADLDGNGDTVGGIVVMRHGENALNVIKRVKAKLEELKPSLPEGVEIVTHLRPLGADPEVHRQSQGRAADGNDHRQHGHPVLPLAHPVGASCRSSPSPSPWRWPSSRCTSWASPPTS